MNGKTITRAFDAIDVIETVDVMVIGGGIAGVAAAVAASRNGASALLLEKTVSLGGLATIGNVIVYLPLCDGKGKQVIGGIGEEMLHLSVRDNQAAVPPGLSVERGVIPACWLSENREASEFEQERASNRFQVSFNPASYVLALENWVLENKVKLLYDSSFCDVVIEGDSITHVLVMTKQGIKAIRCGCVIDASGDADVCHVAGEPCESPTTNVRCGWFYCSVGGEVRLICQSEAFRPNPSEIPENVMGFGVDDVFGSTNQVVESRKMIMQKLEELRRNNPNEGVYPLWIPTMPTFRMSRRLRRENELNERTAKNNFENSIGMMGDWRIRGPVYNLTYESITSVKTKNLFTAGRCVSVDNDLWDVTRVIPVCAVTGEAAGTAAAMVVKDKLGSHSALPIDALQERLRSQKVMLPC